MDQQTATSAQDAERLKAETLKASRQGLKFMSEQRETNLRSDVLMNQLPKHRLRGRFYRDPSKGRAAVWAQEAGYSAKSLWSPFVGPRR